MSAFVAVTMISLGLFSSMIFLYIRAYSFSDFVLREELRVQAKLNIGSCLEYLSVVIRRNDNFHGDFSNRDFGCIGNVTKRVDGLFDVNIRSKLSGVTSYSKFLIKKTADDMEIIEEIF